MFTHLLDNAENKIEILVIFGKGDLPKNTGEQAFTGKLPSAMVNLMTYNGVTDPGMRTIIDPGMRMIMPLQISPYTCIMSLL